MTLRKLVLALATLCVAAIAPIAAGNAASITRIRAVTTFPPTVKINRYIQDGLRWDRDVYTVRSGGTLHIVNRAADEGPHTFTVVLPKNEPRTGLQVVRCLICQKLGKAHGADPNSQGPPKFPFLENGVGQATPPLVDRPGDSGITGEGKVGEYINLKVTARRGTKLNFMCLIHPWMQAEVVVT